MAGAEATPSTPDSATQTPQNESGAGGLIAGAFLTVVAYGVVAHQQGMSLGTMPEPWRTLFVVTGAAGLTSALGVSLIGGLATSKPAPVKSLRQLRLLFNFNVISFVLMATMALISKTPSTVVANKARLEFVVKLGFVLWVAGGFALVIGNAMLGDAIRDAQRSSAPSSESKARPTSGSNTADEATPSERDQEKKE